MDVQRAQVPAAEGQRFDMNKNALIIFVKNPQAGKVKTRLAASVGDAKALSIYSYLLSYTFNAVQSATCSKYVFYSDWIEEGDAHHYLSRRQEGRDLGERIKNAFQELFETGYQKLAIIGSDCPDITAELIDRAFNCLNARDVVIGPASDGGYYLLGMKRLHKELFEDIPWSTAKVFERTLEKLTQQELSYEVLEQLHDIDEEKDWLLYQSKVNV